MGFTDGPELSALLGRANRLGIVHTEAHFDETEDKLIVRRVQDIEPILERNKQLQQDPSQWWSESRDMLWVADIPFAVAEQWMREHGISPHEFMNMDPGEGWLKRKLEDPANSFMRIYPGEDLMGFADNTELLASLATFSDRDDMTAVWPDLVKLAEAQASLDLRLRQEIKQVTSVLVANQDYIDLPADYVNTRMMRLDTNPTVTIEGATPLVFNFHKDTQSGETPRVSVHREGRLYLAPTPIVAHPYTLWYEARALAIAVSLTNWLLSNYPNVYLYGTLVQAAGGYLANDERIAGWKALYDVATNEVRRNEWRTRAGGGPLVMRAERWA